MYNNRRRQSRNAQQHETAALKPLDRDHKIVMAAESDEVLAAKVEAKAGERCGGDRFGAVADSVLHLTRLINRTPRRRLHANTSHIVTLQSPIQPYRTDVSPIVRTHPLVLRAGWSSLPTARRRRPGQLDRVSFESSIRRLDEPHNLLFGHPERHHPEDTPMWPNRHDQVPGRQPVRLP